MVKVKNKVLIALSILLCAVLLSGLFVIAKPQSGINVKAESMTLTDEQMTQRRANPGLYETNSMNFVKNSSGQDYTWQQMIDEGVVTTASGGLRVNTANSQFQVSTTSSGYVTGDLVVGAVDGLVSLNLAFNYMDIETLDLYNLDTTNVTNMGQMTFVCNKIKHLYWNTATFTTSNVKNMGYMFGGLFALEDLDISHFDMSNVTNVIGMFSGCSASSIKLPTQFVTSQVTNLRNMFLDCKNLKTINLGGFDTSSVTEMTEMFSGCSSLTGLVFPENFNTSKVTDMSKMFKDCSSLKSLDLSVFNTEILYVMDNMFSGCSGLTKLDLSNFTATEGGASMRETFSGCTNLRSVDLRNFDISDATGRRDLLDVFKDCNNLVSFGVPNMIEGQSIDLPAISSLKVDNADHYGYVGDDGVVISITTDDASAITYEVAGKMIELYDSEDNSLIKPIEPATGVNASVVAIVCSIVAVLMIVITYVVISNKKNSKRKVNAINVDNNKRK